MEGIIGEKTIYVVYQERKELSDSDEVISQPLTFDLYNGSIYTTSRFEDATHFVSKEKATELARLHNDISEILEQELNYVVIEQVDTRKEVFREIGEPEPEPDPEEPELPKEPEEPEEAEPGDGEEEPEPEEPEEPQDPEETELEE